MYNRLYFFEDLAMPKKSVNPDYSEEDLKSVEDILIPINDGPKPYKDGLLHEKVKKYPAGYRKLVFTKESGNGIIVGQTMKREGYYWPGYGPSAPNWDDSEPPVFDAKKTYTFWIVATKMNEKVLVPKTTI